MNKADKISKAASVLGSIKTEKKTITSRENGKKGGRPFNRRVIYLSGEGTVGNWHEHTGKKSGLALARLMTREQCGGDRWCRIFVETDLDDNFGTPVYQGWTPEAGLTEELRAVSEAEID